MAINEALLREFETGLEAQAEKVTLPGMAVEVTVFPASVTQISSVALMIGESVALKDLVVEALGSDEGLSDEALVLKLVDLLTRVPDMLTRWGETMQPNVDLPVDRFTLLQFATVALEFLLASARGSEGQGWSGLGKRAAALLGGPEES